MPLEDKKLEIRKRDRPKTIWRRSVEHEDKIMRMEWEDLAAAAQDRDRWRNLLKTLWIIKFLKIYSSMGLIICVLWPLTLWLKTKTK